MTAGRLRGEVDECGASIVSVSTTRSRASLWRLRPSTGAPTACGIERWPEKTLQDRKSARCGCQDSEHRGDGEDGPHELHALHPRLIRTAATEGDSARSRR